MRLLAFTRHRLAWTAALVSVVTACSQTPPPAVVQAKSTPKPVVVETADTEFVHPAPTARISSSFANYIVKSRKRKHHGTDFAAPVGTPVYAARAGVVLSADNTSLSGDFGNAVLIDHGDQFRSLSAHLSQLDVQIGDFVQAGQQIGLVGKTGRATGAHLHFELWQNDVPKDPLLFLPITESQRLAVKKPEAAAPQLANAVAVSERASVTSNKSTSKKSRKSVSQSSKTKQTTKLAKANRSQKKAPTRQATAEKKQLVAANSKSVPKSSKTKVAATKQPIAKAAASKTTVANKKVVASTNKAAANTKTTRSSKTVKTTQLTKNTTEAPSDDQGVLQKKRGGLR